MLRWIVWRDLMLAWRRRADMLSTVFFFVIVVSFVVIALRQELLVPLLNCPLPITNAIAAVPELLPRYFRPIPAWARRICAGSPDSS